MINNKFDAFKVTQFRVSNNSGYSVVGPPTSLEICQIISDSCFLWEAFTTREPVIWQDDSEVWTYEVID